MTRKVEEISKDDAIPFLMKVHYARSIPQLMHCYCLFIDDKLCGVVTYGIPASPSLCRGLAGEDEFYNVLELNRLVICDPTPNNASYLVGRSLRLLPKHKYVVSYADQGAWGHVGYVYQACNFLYTGLSAPRTDVASNGKHSRTAYHKGMDTSQRQPRSRKHRYIYICASGERERGNEGKNPIQDFALSKRGNKAVRHRQSGKSDAGVRQRHEKESRDSGKPVFRKCVGGQNMKMAQALVEVGA